MVSTPSSEISEALVVFSQQLASHCGFELLLILSVFAAGHTKSVICCLNLSGCAGGEGGGCVQLLTDMFLGVKWQAIVVLLYERIVQQLASFA